MTKREPYWDYMMRRGREDREAGNNIMSTTDIMKKEVFDKEVVIIINYVKKTQLLD